MDTAPAHLLPLRSLARRLGIPLTWLRREAEAGRIPALKAGTVYLCDADAVERALEEHAREAQKGAARGVPHA